MPRPLGTVGWSGGSHNVCPAMSLGVGVLSLVSDFEQHGAARRGEESSKPRRPSARKATFSEGQHGAPRGVGIGRGRGASG